jgi:hypothetical protein
MAWNQNQQTYKVIFLVGDAPAHMDYQDDVKYPATMAVAQSKGIIVNTIQAGQDPATTANWQQLARLGNGYYFQVEQTGNAVAIATPFDKKLAQLSTRMDDTRLYYGNKQEKTKQKRKISATTKLRKLASEESLARRAAFNVAPSGKTNFLGNGELVDAISSGRVDLSSIANEDLPASIQAMKPDQQKIVIREKARQRDILEREIKVLAEKRNNYLKQEVKQTEGIKDSLDAKIYSAIRTQAGGKGLIYDDDSAKY